MDEEADDHVFIQAQHLPTGSISFGKFETEALSWERRSSFSHNRYLEEVEKCSTPGSVTKKKAYFEAKFRRKGSLPLPIPSVSQNENRPDYIDEYHGQHDEDEPLEQLQSDADDGVQFSWYDESPSLSDEIRYEVMDGKGDEATSTAQSLAIDAPVAELATLETNAQDKSCAQVERTQELDLSLVGNTQDHAELEVDKQVEDAERSCSGNQDDVSVDIHMEANGSSHSKISKKNPKMVKGTSEHKSAILNPKEQSSPSKILQKSASQRRNPSSFSSPRITRSNMANGTSSKTKIDKNLDSRASSVPKAIKTEEFAQGRRNADINGGSENKSSKNSEKNLKLKSDSISPESVPGRHSTSVSQSSNRSNRVIDSVRSHLKTAGTIFGFKSNERAEKRKELQERHHAREAQMNRIHAKSQEERDVKLKQFRKSLNFKATPMPSFYHENVAKVATGQKASAKTPPPQAMRSSSTKKASQRVSSPTADLKAVPAEDACQEGSSTGQHRNSIEQVQVSGLDNPADLRDVTRDKKTETGKREGRSRAKPASLQGKKDEKERRTGRSGDVKAGRSNHMRTSPAIHVAS